MTELREAGEISTGELLDGRYRLEERIGEGGMARVYRAEDTVLGRTVAVKILRAPGRRARRDRARALRDDAARVAQPPRCSSRSSTRACRKTTAATSSWSTSRGSRCGSGSHRGPIESAEAASLAVDIAEALHVAHTAGIVHRDIKPSNVLLWRSPLPGREWRAKIADFGIAYLLDSSRITTPGLMVGTVAYIAPEQARGAAPAPAADIYALGPRAHRGADRHSSVRRRRGDRHRDGATAESAGRAGLARRAMAAAAARG